MLSLGDTEPLQSTFPGKDDRAPPTSFTIATSTFVSNPSPPLLSYRVIFLLSLSLVLGQCTGPQSTAPSWTPPPPDTQRCSIQAFLCRQHARPARGITPASRPQSSVCVSVQPQIPEPHLASFSEAVSWSECQTQHGLVLLHVDGVNDSFQVETL